MLAEILRAFAIFVVFGYFEKVFNLGFGVSVALGIYKYWDNDEILVLAISFVQILMEYLQLKPVGYVIFLIVDLVFVVYQPKVLFSITDNSSDMHIIFRPYEKEIRTFLFKHNPSILHRVDNLLDHYQGKEQQLFRDIVEEHSKIPSESTAGDQRFHDCTPTSEYGSYSTFREDMGPKSEAYINNYSCDSSTCYSNNYKEDAFNNRYQEEHRRIIGYQSPGSGLANSPKDATQSDPGCSSNEIRRLHNIRKEVVSMFQRFHQSMLPKVDILMRNYRGREDELLEYLSEEYDCDLTPGILDYPPPSEYDDILRPGMLYSDAEKIRTAMYQARKVMGSTIGAANSISVTPKYS